MTMHYRWCPLEKCCCYYCYPSDDGGVICIYPDEEPKENKTYGDPCDYGSSCVMDD